MNAFDAVRSFFTGKKAGSANSNGTWEVLTGGRSGINQQNLLEANKEWVFIAVDRVASSTAGLRFKVMKYAKNGDDQEVFAGPLVDFLETPAEGFTGKDFIYLNTAYQLLAGNAFWEWLGKGKVKPLIPTRVSPIIANGVLVGFKYVDGITVRAIIPENMLHDRQIDPAKPHWGVGKLQRIAKWVDTSSFVAEFLNRFFVNGATFGGFITTEEESEERIKLIKLGLKQDHAGVENAHKLGILPKGSDFKPTTASMSDMEMGATDDRYRDKILAGFGVPKTLVGLTTEVNRASAEASEYIYAKYTITPIVNDLLNFLNNSVAAKLDSSGQMYFAVEDFIPVDVAAQNEERKTALGNQPYKTINEVRASVGLPPVKGGDVVLGSPMFVPLGTPSASPDPTPEPDNDNEPKKALPARARVFIQREKMAGDILEKAAGILAKADVSGSREDEDAAAHKSFVSRVDDHRALLAGKMRDFNNRQQRDVTQRLNQITKAIKKGDVFDMDGEVTLLVDFVTPLLKGLLVEQAIEEFKAQNFPGDFDAAAPALRDIVEGVAKRLAKSYNSTTASLIASTLNEGIGKGESLGQLTERVHNVYSYSDTVRAEAVAHTEAFTIANEGSRAAYKQSGVVKTMRWYTAEDERVCQFCGQENGRIVGIDEDFYEKGTTITGRDGGTMKLDYRTIDVPPLHTRCRCFVRPEEIVVS
jgi:HK97 family phage portal protein